MTDIATLQTAVDVAQAALDAFYADQMTRLPTQEAWDALTQEEKITEWDTEGTLKFSLRTAKRALNEENARRDAFYVARQAAFDAFEAQKTTDRGVLNALWQEKEDNGFDPDYVPA